MAKSVMDDLPGIPDLERRAKRRIPFFSWEYLSQGTGAQVALDRNIDAINRITFTPQFMKGALSIDTEVEVFGVRYAAPIGIAPVGLTGLIWPGADEALAKAAAKHRIPYTLSTVATEKPEVAGPNADGMGWFQLYPPRDHDIREDLIDRVAKSGFTTLVVTADVPAPSRRERQRKARVRVPPVIGPRLVFHSAIRPFWAVEILRQGMPRFRGLEAYVDETSMKETAGFVGANLGGTLSWEYLDAVREQWDGPLVIKGVLGTDDAQKCIDHGADGVWVSNHGGRQLDAAPASIDALGPIVERVGDKTEIFFDSGVRDGLDVARAIALGASMVFCGRAFMFGLGALGADGPGHAYQILHEGLVSTMGQLGCERLDQLASRLDA